MIGTTLDGRYEILSLIGEGSMSHVYKANHALMQRLVAVKVLKAHLISDTAMLARFRQEAKAISVLNHVHIVSVYDSGFTFEGQPYLVMDLVEGESLASRLSAQGKLPVDEAVEIILKVAAALAHAHKHGIIHRDIKPSNILLPGSTDADCAVKLIDFGIAKLLSLDESTIQKLTQSGELFGSPLYASPEQCMGRELDCRSDIYSLGCVLYEALGGERPFAGSTAIEIASRHLTELPPPLKGEPDRAELWSKLNSIVSKCMEKDKGKRFQSMLEFNDALNQSIAKNNTAKKLGISAAFWRPALSAALTLLASGLLCFWIAGNPDFHILISDIAVDFEEGYSRADSSSVVQHKIDIADYCMSKGKYASAADRLKQLISSFTAQVSSKNTTDLTQLANLNYKECLCLTNLQRPTEAQHYADEGAKLIDGLTASGVDKPAMESLLLEAILAEQLLSGKGSERMLRFELMLANFYLQTDRISDARRTWQEVVSEALKSGRIGQVRIQLENTGTDLRSAENYEPALFLYEALIRAWQEAGETNNGAYISDLVYLASMLKIDKQYDRAERILRQELPQLKQMPYAAVSYMTELAEMEFKQGKAREGNELMTKANTLALTMKKEPAAIGCLNQLAGAYINLGKYKVAEPLQKLAVELADTATYPVQKDRLIVLSRYKEILEHLGRTADAGKLQAKIESLKSSLAQEN